MESRLKATDYRVGSIGLYETEVIHHLGHGGGDSNVKAVTLVKLGVLAAEHVDEEGLRVEE